MCVRFPLWKTPLSSCSARTQSCSGFLGGCVLRPTPCSKGSSCSSCCPPTAHGSHMLAELLAFVVTKPVAHHRPELLTRFDRPLFLPCGPHAHRSLVPAYAFLSLAF